MLSIVRISEWLFVSSFIVLHLCVCVNQAAHVNFVNENDVDVDGICYGSIVCVSYESLY